ncbi:MAG TPA: FIST N-terminal domain-containing protein [Tepidisphaeraceae bacterium]|jgi:hypothetical protein|nr:FIST N-terminal domain-containing protein [Tepidisphaeraceae bacterium]
MKISRTLWTKDSGWSPAINALPGADQAGLVLVFGATSQMKNGTLKDIQKAFPKAYVCGCSTAGEIAGEHVLDDSVCVTAIQFQHTTFRTAAVSVSGPADSFSAGAKLAMAIPQENLVHAFVLSDGLSVNGSELVKGITSRLPAGVAVTGGLSGDGARFAETYVCADGIAEQKRIVLLGFYGSRLRVGCGSMGGWDSFGPERRITRSKANVLFELDGRSALELYKEYLGSHAAGLPASGLLFPLALRQENSGESVVRTILAVSEKDQSMTFAGDVPEGALARLMRANFDRLVDGAAGAARTCRQKIGEGKADLAILISCVGRKLVLKQRIEEEVEAVLDVLGEGVVATGFYSYGEISPFTPEARCALHNQTMTVTTFTEV